VPVGINPMEAAVTPDGAKVFVTNSGSGNISVIDTATNKVTTVNSGKYDIYSPVCVTIVHSTDPNDVNQSIKATLNVTDQNKKEIPNTTDIGGVDVQAGLSKDNESNGEFNNSNYSDSESENGSSSNGNKSRENNSAPGFGLLGGLTCLYGGWKLRKN
jgi:YVTN family beta-propeller protein